MITVISNDTEAELELVRKVSLEAGADAAVSANHWAEGGKGAIDLAKAVIEVCKEPNTFKLLYEDGKSIKEKISAIATEIYHAQDVSYSEEAEKQIETYTQQGFSHLPICMAKTQYSFSDDASAKGAPSGKFAFRGEERWPKGWTLIPYSANRFLQASPFLFERSEQP